jgi:hypothetical protein
MHCEEIREGAMHKCTGQIPRVAAILGMTFNYQLLPLRLAAAAVVNTACLVLLAFLQLSRHTGIGPAVKMAGVFRGT